MADETLPKRVAIYARVSSDQQTLDSYRDVCRQVAWVITSDSQIGGTGPRQPSGSSF
jgi:predicted site-specific integrase-resolvase